MKETVPTLRAYFNLCGLAGIFWALIRSAAATSCETPIGLILIFDTGFALAYLYTGENLPKLIQNSAQRITGFLKINFAWSCMKILFYVKVGAGPAVLVLFFLKLLLVWYLLRNVRRLAAETQPPPDRIGEEVWTTS